MKLLKLSQKLRGRMNEWYFEVIKVIKTTFLRQGGSRFRDQSHQLLLVVDFI